MTRSFLPGRPLVFLASFSALAMTCLADRASEMVNNGDFGGQLTHWNINPNGDIDRQMENTNSPFDEFYPNNDLSVRLEDLGGVGFHTALNQRVDNEAEIIVLSFDFFFEEGTQAGGGWRLSLQNVDTRVVGVFFSPTEGFRINCENSESTTTQLREGTWYHVRIAANLKEGNAAAILTEDGFGEVGNWPNLRLENPAAIADGVITQIFLQEATAPDRLSAPVLIDNISLRSP